MNGRELSGTTLLARAPLCDEATQRKDEEELQRWAELVAGCLTSTAAENRTFSGLGFPEPEGYAPAGWRPGVGEMTALDRGTSVLPGSSPGSVTESSGDVSDLNRIQVRISTKEFGEVALVVERADQGLRIVVGALDERVVSTLRQEVSAVRRALENGGQTVGSLEIVRMNQVGTNLAQTKMPSGSRARRTRDEEQAPPNPNERKKNRRINLIG